MKRGAEDQLTKDHDDIETEDNGPGLGFTKADNSTLAKRIIKSLPKRSAGLGTPNSSTTPTSAFQPSTTNVFASAAGGSDSRSQSPSPPKFPGFGGFSGFGVTSTPVTFGSPVVVAPTAPYPLTNASNTAPILPTLPTPSPANSFSPSPSLSSTASPATKAFASFLSPSRVYTEASTVAPVSKDADDDSALEYYKSLRGLNVSFMKAVTAAVETDAFVDVSDLLSQYTDMRLGVQRKYELAAPSGRMPVSAKPLGGMPTPPSTFAPFSTDVKGTVAAISSAPSASFGFASSSVKPTSPVPALPLTSESVSPARSPFSFSESSSASRASAFPSFFSSSKPKGDVADAAGESSMKQTSQFGAGFGSTAFGSLGSAGTRFAFGTSTSPPFALGSSTLPGSGKKTDLVISRPQPSENTEMVNEETTGESGENGVKSTSPPNHDAEGKGEEDEETTFSIRSKVYKLVKMDPATEPGKAPFWSDLGVGVLRLKKHKEKEIRRVLLRNSGTGKIIINFNLYSALAPKLDEKTKTVSFVGHEHSDGGETKPVSYKLRVKTEQDARDLKAGLEREIEATKSST